MMVTKYNLEHYLSKHFKHTSFRVGQKEIIFDVLQKNDVLGVLPTGSGKSLCYQLPALILPGTTIVVSPLISLMIDQVRHLKANHFKSVIALNSLMTWQERQKVYRNLSKYKLIYVSPELLQQEQLINKLCEIQVSLFVIDEAHCISQWGHEFRPDYLRLINVIERLNNPPILALTATATYEVQQDILNTLQRPNMYKHIFPIDRENIALYVDKVSNNHDKLKKLMDILSTYCVPTIIYFSSRRMTEKIATEINQKLPKLRTSYYHGGMETIDRITIQQQFINDQLDVICCTSAFGMGINKQNIRLVIHYHFPAELESYIQEVGRAGRDGKSSVGVTLFSNNDIKVQQNIIENEFPSKKQLDDIYQFLSTVTEPNLESIKENILDIVNRNEIHFRLLRYQLEKHGIIKEDYIVHDEKMLQIAFKRIHTHIQQRFKIKRKKLMELVNWLSDSRCLRKQLYQSFQDSYKKAELCCSNCDFSLSLWEPDEITTATPKNTNWKEKLDELFLIGVHNETR